MLHTHARAVEHIAMLVPLIPGPVFLRISAVQDKYRKENSKTRQPSTHHHGVYLRPLLVDYTFVRMRVTFDLSVFYVSCSTPA